MTDKKPVQNRKDDFIRPKKKTVDETSPQLAEEELERVVGGYIGETEKNRN